MVRYLLILLVLSFGQNSFAQVARYSLKDCIDIALQNSLSVKQAEVNVQQSNSQVKTQQLSFLPSANVSASHSYNFGRSIDRFSNEFVNTTVRNNFFSLNTNMVIYNGMQQQNNLKMQKANAVAANEGLKQSRNDIAMQVADAFLQYILAKENVEIAVNQKAQTQEQLNLANKRFKAGSINQGEVLNLNAQLASDQLAIVTANNSVAAAKLNTRLLLLLPLEQEFELLYTDSIKIDASQLQTAEQVYAVALSTMPQISRAKAQVQASELALKASSGARAPSVSAFANMSTVFSGQAKEIVGNPFVTGAEPIGIVDGTGQVVNAPTFGVNTKTIGFGQQLENNFGQSLGVQVNVPIFNGNQVNNAILTSQTNLSMSKINLESMKLQLRNEVALAVNNANLSFQKYLAAQLSLNAQEKSASFAKKSYEAGMLNYFQYNSARTLYQNAQNQLQSAKYEYLFRKMIVNFYTNNSWNI